MDRERLVKLLGGDGTAAALMMWTSQWFQIMLNLQGQKGSLIFPVLIVVNCTLWCGYTLLMRPRLVWVFIANAPGIPLGFVNALTAL